MDRQWRYLDPQRQVQGPVSDEQLRQLFADGRVTQETLIWTDGWDNWRPAGPAHRLGIGATAPAAEVVALAGKPRTFGETPGSSLAVATFVLGVVTIVTGCGFALGLLTGPPGVITGVLCLRKRPSGSPKVLAILGLIFSAIGVLVGLAYWIIMGAMFWTLFSAGAGGGHWRPPPTTAPSFHPATFPASPLPPGAAPPPGHDPNRWGPIRPRHLPPTSPDPNAATPGPWRRP